MKCQPAIIVALALGIWLGAAPCRAARVKWWLSDVIVARVGLTRAQVENIDRIFEETRPHRLRLQRALDDLESAFTRAIDDGQDALAADLVPRVESARMAHNIARTMMLIRMSRLLTPEQRAKLQDIRDPSGVPTDPPGPFRSSHPASMRP